MKYKQNLHTHTIYCDGKDTPSEMIEAAIKFGYDSIGFSGHSYVPFATYGMTIDDMKLYIKEVESLKKEYKGKIDILCGIEYDIYSKLDISCFDYVIGSVHALLVDGEYLDFDGTQTVAEGIIEKYFHGDGMAYAKKYYETLAQLPNYVKYDILGHFDLITKHSDYVHLFEETSDEYISYVRKAAETLIKFTPYFEVNAGTIARGYRKTPYPSPKVLKELKKLGFKPVITTDCHDSLKLECGYENAVDLLLQCGYEYHYILKSGDFLPVKLQERSMKDI